MSASDGDQPPGPPGSDAVPPEAHAAKVLEHPARKKAREQRKLAFDWEGELTFTERGMRPDACNITTILTNHPSWQHVLSWDEFRQNVVSRNDPPWHLYERDPADWTDADSLYGREWGDADYRRCQMWFERAYRCSFAIDKVMDGVAIVALHHRFHPVRDYLERCGAEWDGESRINRFLLSYFNVTAGEPEYVRKAGRYWLISAVARVMDPGCKVDHMLIVEGAQGIYKTEAFRQLCGPQWFLSTKTDLDSKEVYMQLNGRWIVEFGELAALSKGDQARIKQFMTESSNDYVPKYKSHSVNVKRQSVFCGTVNDDEYLRDSTGGRRYWPVSSQGVNMAAIIRDRDQIWGEAYRAYMGHFECLEQQAKLAALAEKLGNPAPEDRTMCSDIINRCEDHRWWPAGDRELALFGTEQGDRQETDDWEPSIAKWVAALPEHRNGCTSDEAAMECLKMPVSQIDRAVTNRVKAILRRLGYRRYNVSNHGVQGWRYMLPTSDRLKIHGVVPAAPPDLTPGTEEPR